MKAQKNNPLISITKSSFVDLPTPRNISYIWNIGSLLGVILITQIITGLMISIHYTANTSIAFESTVHIIRDINQGWILRNIHINGASAFFILIYIHISRGIIFSSFIKKETWLSGTTIILTLMATAFIGYVLPWGQISFWGATVITNLASAIPVVGPEVVKWLWGGFSVSNATLNRFFSLHFLLPFIIAALSIVHLITLHQYISSNPLGVFKKKDMIKFHPFFSWKDLSPSIILISCLITISSIAPTILGDPENFNIANPLVTPVHIQPEWYFLFAYAILRGIPNKLGGVVALLIRILIIATFSSKRKNKASSKFNPQIKIKFWCIAASFIILTWLGANPVEEPFERIRKITRVTYFASIIIIYSKKVCLENKPKTDV